MEAYKTWVRRNRDYVHSLESLANGLTWLLPERFSTSEIGPEAVTSFLGIITAVNEHIIDTTPTHVQRGTSEPYSFPYSLCISAIKELETLVEVAAQYFYGDDKKWDFIAVMEAIKVLIRLAMFQSNGYKMLLHGGEISNVDSASDNNADFKKPGSHQRPALFQNIDGRNLSNLEGKALFALNRFGENARRVSDPVWFSHVQQQQAIMKPPERVISRPTLSTVLSEKSIHGALFILGEVLFVTRPLIYVLFIRKYGTRSWIPWLLSLSVDFIGVGLLTQVSVSRLFGKEQQFHLTDSERNELKRRKLLWALYLMRDPCFSKYTRQKLENTEKLLEPVPLIGLLTAKIVELVTGAQTRYAYMSGS